MQITSGNYMFQIDCLQKQHITLMTNSNIHGIIFNNGVTDSFYYTTKPSISALWRVYWILII